MKKVNLKELQEKAKAGENLSESDFRGCDLRGVQLPGAKLDGSNFRYANLEKANLKGASIKNANLRHAVLRHADLRNADLTGSDLSYADMRGALVVGTVFKNAKLFSVKGVSNKVFFRASTLEKLIEEDRAEFRGEELFLKKEGRGYKLIEALRFLEIVEGSDEKGYLGKVKPVNELKSEGCEVMPGSVICGETVYSVEEGFLGIPSTEAQAEEKEEKEEASDVQMLVEYFLRMDGSKS